MPFVFSFKANPHLGAPGSQITVSAIATDTSGNRGTTAVSLPITVVADQAPAIAIVAPGGTVSARNGDRIDVRVTGSDDVGLTQIGYKANTGQPQDCDAPFDPAASPRTESFVFTILTAGRLVAVAHRASTAGHLVLAAPVRDGDRRRESWWQSPGVGRQGQPGPDDTYRAAEDLGGLMSSLSPLAVGQSAHDRPGADAVAHRSRFRCPQRAAGPTLTLDAVASIAPAAAARQRVILPVADTVPPTVRSRARPAASSWSWSAVHRQRRCRSEIALARVEIRARARSRCPTRSRCRCHSAACRSHQRPTRWSRARF